MKQNRMLDANINRSAEGLRVLEDIARFSLDNQKLSAAIRNLRHRVRDLFKGREHSLLAARDAGTDVGQTTSQQDRGSDQRNCIKDTVLSNFKRVQEASRTIEEILKSQGEYTQGKHIEELRFSVYELEAELMSYFKHPLPPGIYGILGEKFSLGRSNAEVARQMVEAGVSVLQYREKLKYKSMKAIYEECRTIREITRDAGVPFIVNDYADIALMVEADGIHQGQDDIPIKALRKIAPDMILGCSTHSPAQAQQAIADGADYIGVGPIFTTRTKEDVCDAVGLEYLEYAAKNHDIPFVAIGGIKRHNLPQVLERGAQTVCLVTEIIGAKDIKKRIQEIQEIFNSGEEK